jgi:hypothetical protein
MYLDQNIRRSGQNLIDASALLFPPKFDGMRNCATNSVLNGMIDYIQHFSCLVCRKKCG